MRTQRKLSVEAKLTSKGQITIPNAVRRELGLSAGARLRFVGDRRNMRIVPVEKPASFLSVVGVGNPGIPKGQTAVEFFRELRGHDDFA